MKRATSTMTLCALFVSTTIFAGCAPEEEVVVNESVNSEHALVAEVWADNWFAAYVGDTKIHEDSVSITTERSFNAERFSFDADYPFTLNFVIKDFKENDTGLEYIGEGNQQMGDGGFILQVKDVASGEYVAVSSADFKCWVTHQAPLNKSCEKSASPSTECQTESSEEPSGWMSDGVDTSGWENATEYSASQVDPKGGYDGISWSSDAKLIWTSDLEIDNTLLCKVTVSAPE